MIDQQNESLPKKLEPNEVREWKNFSSFSINGEADSFLKGIFGDFLDLFYDEVKKTGNEKWRNLATNFLKKTLDPGLRRQITLLGENLNPVLMLGRIEGITWLKEKIGLEENNADGNIEHSVKRENFQILRLDVSNVFLANQVEDGKGGDYLLNKVAQAINESVDTLRKQLGEDFGILPIRYGGDEFVIFVVGGQLNNQEINTIKTSITKQEAFFGVNKEKRNISLKNDEIELINPSKIDDPEEKKFFYSFLKRGIILSADELKEEYKKIKNLDSFEVDINQDSIYPEEIESIKEEAEKIKAKIQYILSLHPEFKVPFYLASYLDVREGNSLSRQSTMLKILENHLIDPLLNRLIITRFDLEDHLRSESINRILSFEIKLKEVNELLGYGYADMLIVKAWDKIKEVLGEDHLRKIKIMRFGGFISLLISDDTLTPDQIEKLRNMTITLNNITHNVGFSDTKIENYKNLSQEDRIKKIIETMFIEPDINWMKKNLEFILGNQSIFDIFIQKMKKGEKNITDEELSDKNIAKQLELFLRYLLSEKRGIIRRERLNEVFNKIGEEKNRLNELLVNI